MHGTSNSQRCDVVNFACSTVIKSVDVLQEAIKSCLDQVVLAHRVDISVRLGVVLLGILAWHSRMSH